MLRLSRLAELIDGALYGDPNLEISDAKITARAGEQDITFVTCAKNFEAFLTSPSPAAIVSNSVFEELESDQSECSKST